MGSRILTLGSHISYSSRCAFHSQFLPFHLHQAIKAEDISHILLLPLAKLIDMLNQDHRTKMFYDFLSRLSLMYRFSLIFDVLYGLAFICIYY